MPASGLAKAKVAGSNSVFRSNPRPGFREDIRAVFGSRQRALARHRRGCLRPFLPRSEAKKLENVTFEVPRKHAVTAGTRCYTRGHELRRSNL